MFRCENCGIVPEKKLKANQQENKFVVETRSKEYKNIKIKRENGKKIKKEFKTEGVEIVKEISVCHDCLDKLNNGEIAYGNKSRPRKGNQIFKGRNSTATKRRKIV